MKRSNIETFIKKANKRHNNKYRYDFVKYTNAMTKVKIQCPIHGIFYQTPSGHLNSSGCLDCSYEARAKKRTRTVETFRELANKRHNNKYCYDFVEYKNSDTKVKIQCPKHGIFKQEPGNHLHGSGCYYCGREVHAEKKLMTLEMFIDLANKRHDNKYCYDLVEYEHSRKNIKILCPEHGLFSQEPGRHLEGSGCMDCGNERQRIFMTMTLEKFKERANKRHNNKYCYDLAEYKGSREKVKIRCPHHGLFEQVANTHLKSNGCIACGIEEATKKRLINPGPGSYYSRAALNGDYKNQTINIYLISLTGKKSNEIFYKVGLTEQELHRRRPGGTNYSWLELQTIRNADKKLAVLFEQSLHNDNGYFKNIAYKPTYKFDGYTECYHSLENWDMEKDFNEFCRK